MKTYPRTITTIASFLLLAGGSPASAQYNHLVASVPFEFMIGESTLPRDIYRVSRVDGHTDVLLVRSARRGIFILGHGVESKDGDEMPGLVFHRYDDQYFLREIRFPGRLGLSLPETSEEREAAERKRRADRSDSDVETVRGRCARQRARARFPACRTKESKVNLQFVPKRCSIDTDAQHFTRQITVTNNDAVRRRTRVIRPLKCMLSLSIAFAVASPAVTFGQTVTRNSPDRSNPLRISSEAIEALVSRVMPSVVQIIVTGYRTQERGTSSKPTLRSGGGGRSDQASLSTALVTF